ncbi:MAG: damage-control phosphatase ARMT1 family protein [Elainellaceae cyanobacterium]
MSFPVQQVQLPQIAQVPPPLMMGDPGSFAHYTVTSRWPAVIEVIQENSLDPVAVRHLQQLCHELQQGTIRSLEDQHAPDWAQWEQDLAPYNGLNWVDVPWLFAEFYLYRRILEAVNYFRPDAGGADPFFPQKQAALNSAVPQASRPAVSLSQSLYGSLWGNRADLSLKPGESWQHESREQGSPEHILVDQSPEVLHHLHHRAAAGHVDIVADNAGAELIADLALAASILQTYPKLRVKLHLKAYPTFVSDATRRDVEQTLTAIAGAPLAGEIRAFLSQGALQLCDSPIWNRPLAFWQLQAELEAQFRDSQLVILKGDANYRRLLGDCCWPVTASFNTIAAYFSAPVAALRTLKSELVVGLTTGQVSEVTLAAPNWMTAGEWGLIQARLD